MTRQEILNQAASETDNEGLLRELFDLMNDRHLDPSWGIYAITIGTFSTFALIGQKLCELVAKKTEHDRDELDERSNRFLNAVRSIIYRETGQVMPKWVICYNMPPDSVTQYACSRDNQGSLKVAVRYDDDGDRRVILAALPSDIPR